MKLTFCVLCGATEQLEHHHVDPNGSDEPENMITVCSAHHGKIHGMKKRCDVRKLTKEGLAKRKAAGVVLGRPVGARFDNKLDDRVDEIKTLRSAGASVAAMAAHLDTARTTLRWYLKSRGL
jgi:hypothetical protein